MERISRRALLVSAGAAAALTASGCKRRRLQCTKLRGVSDQHRRKRVQYAYVDRSRISDRDCKNCSLYIPAPDANSCGGCQLFDGPVHPKGWCTGWKS